MHLSSGDHCLVGTNNRFCGWFEDSGLVFAHPSEVNFTADTMSVIVVLKSNYFTMKIEEQELIHLCSAYHVAPLRVVDYPP